MSFNQVQSVSPRSQPVEQKKEKRDPVDDILRGLQIANGALGIGVNFTTIQNHMAQNDALDREAKGVLAPEKEMQGMVGGLSPVDAGTPGSTNYKIADGSEHGFREQAYMRVPKEAVGIKPPTGYESGRLNQEQSRLDEFARHNKAMEGLAIQKSTKNEVDPNAAFDPKQVDPERKQLAKYELSAGSRSEFGRLTNKVHSAEALQGILDMHPDFQLNPQLQTEMAIGVANLIAPGTATQSMVEHMDPETRGTWIANTMQKFTNQPYSADNPEFVKSFAATIDREKGIAADQLGQIRGKYQGAFPNFMKAKPDEFAKLTGIKLSDYDSNGNYVLKTMGKKDTLPGENPTGTALAAPAGGKTVLPSHPQDEEAVKWALSNRLSKDPNTADKALKILQANGGG